MKETDKIAMKISLLADYWIWLQRLRFLPAGIRSPFGDIEVPVAGVLEKIPVSKFGKTIFEDMFC